MVGSLMTGYQTQLYCPAATSDMPHVVHVLPPSAMGAVFRDTTSPGVVGLELK